MTSRRPTELFEEDELGTERTWHLVEWEFSYQFYIGDPEQPERELHFEVAELYAVGPAFENQLALSAFDLIEALERECPFKEIVIESTKDKLIRKQGSKPGVVFVQGSKKDFYSDKTLRTINFDEFYESRLIREYRRNTQPTYLGKLENGQLRN